MRAGPTQEHGHLRDAVDAALVVERVVLVHDAAVPGVGVGAEADVDHEQQRRVALLQVLDGQEHRALLRRREAAHVILRGKSRNAEQQHGTKTQCNQWSDQLVESRKKMTHKQAQRE